MPEVCQLQAFLLINIYKKFRISFISSGFAVSVLSVMADE